MDELDLALVNALQLDPRAPWSRLAGPLGVDAATLSRRWSRLTAAGNAWVTCAAGPSQLSYGTFALVEVRCAPGTHERVAAELAADACTISVEHTTGNRDLLLTVITWDLAEFGDYVLRRLGRVDGVVSTRTHLAHHLHREASRWRLDSLDQGQRRGLERPGGGEGETRRLRHDEIALMLALAPDGRRSSTALAEETGMPEARVRRVMAGMLSSGRVALRCEAAHRLAGWRVTGMLWLSVPPPSLDAVADGVATMRETRLVCSVAGEANLMANVWVHGLNELAAFEARVVSQHPGVRVVDRSVTLRWVKRVGRMLDAEGRSLAYVPMGAWREGRP
ncbi:Lrp/AsnC family transcriptional regulator [Actinomadura hibisca]|uniref:Lrp/AsnC family transcriptional regulator n=1 Tax=Actinomadura hibisca TaxID=68565 RepID=UPI00083537E1|nr:Lrp/AsnC family transcriptional regulator [Actinomadura hibisca]